MIVETRSRRASRKSREGGAQVGESLPQVRPEGEENVVFHVAVNISRIFRTLVSRTPQGRFAGNRGFGLYSAHPTPMEDA